MNQDIILEKTSEMTLRSGASSTSIDRTENQLGIVFPSDYRQFMMNSDGAVGMVGNTYLDIWSIGDVLQSNIDIHMEEYAPGLVAIASDGGNELFAFDFRTDDTSIVQVPLIGLSLDDAWRYSDTFNNWLIKIAQVD